MKAKSILLAIAVAICCAAEAVVYVKPGATGSGASWSDAADLATAVSSAYAGSSVTTIYAAKGVYTLSAALNLNGNVALYGGFAGTSADETPETRNLSANVSIISGDVNGDDVWTRYYPLTGTLSVTSEKIVKSGKINDLAFENDYDTCAPGANRSDNLVNLVKIDASTANTCVLDGFTLTGGGQENNGAHTALEVGSSAVPVIRHNRFVGCHGNMYCIFFADSSLPTFTSNAVDHCMSKHYGVLGGGSTSTIVKGCTFTGNVHVSTYNNSHGAAAVCLNRGIAISGCTFTRNYCYHSSWNLSVAAAVYCPDYSSGNISGCSFYHNSTYSATGTVVPIVLLSNWYTPRFCTGTLANNRVTVKTSAASVNAACVYTATGTMVFDGLSFLTNTVSVTASAATSVRAATVLQGTSGVLNLVNGTFEENTVAVSAPDGADVLTARGVLQDATTGFTAVYNSTFTGSTAGPDVLSRQSKAGTCGLFALNSVFWSTGAAVGTPRLVGGSASPSEAVCSIVRDLDALDPSVKLQDVREDDPDLAPAAVVTAGKPAVARINARLSYLRETYDVAYSGNTYVFRNGDAESWTNRAGGTLKSGTLIADAVGASRPSGKFTMGASQSLVPGNVTYVFDLGSRAVFDDTGLSTATRQYATGDPVTVPAYTVQTGYSLRKWRDEIPSAAGDMDETFKAYYWGAEIEISPGDDIVSVVTQASASGDGVTISAAAGEYVVTSAFAVASNVRIKGASGTVFRRINIGSKDYWTISNASRPATADPVEISGIVFPGYGVEAGKTPMHLTDCVFSNCVNNAYAFSDTSPTTNHVVLVNCAFYNCPTALRGWGNGNYDLGETAYVTNCLFYGNYNTTDTHNGTALGAAVALSGNRGIFYGCRFEKNRSANPGSDYGIIQGGNMYFTRCQIVDNVCEGDYNIVRKATYCNLSFNHTLFMNNRVLGTRYASSLAKYATGATGIVVEGGGGSASYVNCAFVSNVVDRTETTTYSGVTTLPCHIIYQNRLTGTSYCLFEGNTVRATATTGITPIASVCSTFVEYNGAILGVTLHDNVAANGSFYIRADPTTSGSYQGIWFWNSLFDGEGAEATPIQYASSSLTMKTTLRFTHAPVQTDTRVIRDTTCGSGAVNWARCVQRCDGLVIRCLLDRDLPQLDTPRLYRTSNGKSCRYDPSLVGMYDTGYRNLAGDCTDSYLNKPHTPITDMFGEEACLRRKLPGAYQKCLRPALRIIGR